MSLSGIDTNVLLRLLLPEANDQRWIARQFFSACSAQDPAFVNLVVLAEIFWTLRSRYRMAPSQICDVLDLLLERDDVVVEDYRTVVEALSLCRAGAGFTDSLIAIRNREAGCSTTVTFDQAAARRIPAMDLVA